MKSKFTMISLRIPNALLARIEARARKLARRGKQGRRGFRSMVVSRAIARGLR